MTPGPSIPPGRPWAAAKGGVRVAVRLTPKAARDRIDGLAADAEGGTVLKVMVTAVPEDGKANAALIKLLSKEWRLPKSAFDLIQGATDRRKVLHITGDPDDIGHRLDQWMATRT